jgi:hypothetical protein
LAPSVLKAASGESYSSSALPQFISDTYQEKDVFVSFKRAYSKTDNYGSQFCIELNLKVLAENKIIRPSKYVYGIYILDNFGNDLNVVSLAPRYCESFRPGEERLFVITFSIKPLDNTKFLLLQIPEGIFGNKNPFELKIFNTGLSGANTKEERDRMESGVGLANWQNPLIDFKPENINLGKRDGILYTAMFVGLCGLCSLGFILVCCLKKAKETILGSESFVSFLAHWLNQDYSHLLIIYILSALVSLLWLVFGVIIVIVSNIAITDNMFGVVLFLAAWALMSLVTLWTICEMLNKCRSIDN